MGPSFTDKRWTYSTINATLTYTGSNCGVAPADPITIAATITPSNGAAPYECKVDWDDSPGLNMNTIPWGACAANHTYTSGRGLYPVRWTARDANQKVLTSPDPRTVQITPCNQKPVVPDFTVASGPDSGTYDIVLTDKSYDPDYNWGIHSGPGQIFIEWGSGSPNPPSTSINLTGAASNQQFSLTYTTGGYHYVTTHVRDNATVDTRPECWPSRRCQIFVSRSGVSYINGACSVPTAPLYCAGTE